ncbi:Pol polyprotein [Vitis vinifera]|uniref:Pol polyprotein n=1 Tax=Vitis vinifera TaxID=29760 RepID=A0A438CPS4_VITVI|nr:Pol polyprotein [Vitis vinifera]
MADFVLEYSRRPTSTTNQVNRSGGLYELTEPHAHQALELGSYCSPQLGNIWSKPSGWDSPRLTMKQNTRPSCPDWTSPCAIRLQTPDLQRLATSEYLRTGLYPKILNAHKIRVQAARFTLIGGHLYKRSFTGPYLRCLGHSEAHPWPFAQWGMDIVGPLPAAPAQKKFLLVATDYFSKWVEAEAYASIKDKDVTKFVWKNIVCRFGIPQIIIADNGPQFDSIAFRNFCSELNIRNSYSTPRYPQSNGQAEATNKTLINALKKRLEQAKGKWVEELPGVLWAYRTTPGRPTGNTPFALTYGMDAVIPTEIGLPTIRTDAAKQKDANTELGRNLDWADEVRESASIRMADYQQRASAHYNRKVRPRNFKNGTLVLRKVFENTAEVGAGKFQANWEGPYIVSKANENGAYHLQKLDGTPLLRPWNVLI